MENKSYQCNIDAQEDEDRFVASALITDILKGKGFTNIKCNGTSIKCSVDLKCSCTIDYNTNCNFNVEIKKNTKTQSQLETFPHTLLKQGKLLRMKNESEGLPLYFVVLLNEQYGYIYNCRTINWNDVELVNLRQKRIQYNPNSDWINIPTYRIPYNMGYKFNINQYYNQYRQNKIN